MPLSGQPGSVVNVFTSGSLTTPLPVTSTQENPVYVTGTLAFGGSVTAVNNSVAASGAISPATATLIGGVDDLNHVAMWHVDTNGAGSVYVSGTVLVSNSSGPLGVTGTVGIGGVVAVSQTNLPTTQSVAIVGNLGDQIPGLTTSATLAANQAWTGSWTSTNSYASVAYNIRTNATGTIVHQWSMDGVIPFQWGTDNFGPDRTGTLQAQDMTLRVHAPYYRMIYVNGTGPQTYFTATHTFARYLPMGDTMGIAHQLRDGDDAIVTKAVIAGRTVSGSYVDVYADTSGALMVGNTSANPVWITGVDIQVSLKNTSIFVSMSDIAAVGGPVPLSAAYIGVRNDAGNLQALSATTDGHLWVTGNFATNFPVTQSVVANITASITLPVTMSTGPTTAIWVTGSTGGTSQVTASVPNLTASISNFPVTQSVVANITQSIPLSVTATVANPVQVTGVVGITGPVTFVSQSVTGTVSVGAMPAITFVSQSITGAISVTNVLPTHGVTFVSQSITGTVSVGNTVSVTASVANPVQITGSVNATFTDQAEGAVDGAAPGTAILVGNKSAGGFFRAWKGEPDGSGWITGSVSVLNTVAVSQSTAPASAVWVTASQTNPVGITGTVFVANIAGPQTVTASSVNPVAVTGVIGVSGPVTFVSQSVTGTVSVGNVVSVSATVPLWVSSSTPLWVTSTLALPQYVTGIIGVSGPVTFVSQSVTGTVSVGNVVSITASQTNPVGITGTVFVANIAGPQTVTASSVNPVAVTGVIGVSGPVTFVSQSVTGTVSVGNVVSVSATTPLWVSSSVPLWVTSTLALPQYVTGIIGVSGPVTFVSQSVTGTVSVGNVVSVSQSTTAASAIWVTGTVAANVTASISAINSSVGGTGTTAPFSAALMGLKNDAGQLVPASASALGALYVTSTLANPAWVAISGVMNTVFSGTQLVTGTVHVDNTTVSVTSSVANPIQITGTIHYDNPASGGGTQYGTGTVTNAQTGTLMVGNNAGTVTAISATSVGAIWVTSTLALPQYVTGIIGVSGPVTFVSQSVTGTVSVGNVVSVSATVPLWVSSSVPLWVTSTLALPQYVTGVIGVSGPVTFVSQSVTGTVTIDAMPAISVAEASVRGTGTASPFSATLVAGNNAGNLIPLSASSVGAVLVTSTIANPIWVTGTVAANITASVNASAANVGLTGAATPLQAGLVGGNNAGTFTPISASAQGALFITGSISSVAVEASVGKTGTTAPVSATLAGFKDDSGNLIPLSGTTAGALWVAITGAIDAVFSGTQVVTSTLTNPVYATGTLGISGPVTVTSTAGNPVWTTGTVTIGAMPAVSSVGGTGSVAPFSATFIAGNNAGVLTALSANLQGALLVQGVNMAKTGTDSPVSGALMAGNYLGTLTPFSSSIGGAMFVTSTAALPLFVSSSAPLYITSSVPVIVSSSVPLWVTSTLALPQYVTGVIGISGPVTVTASTANPITTVDRPTTTQSTPVVITASSTSTQLLAANANRIGFTVINLSTANAIYVNLNTSVAAYNSATVRIAADGYYESPFRWTGAVQVAASGVQTAICIAQEFLV